MFEEQVIAWLEECGVGPQEPGSAYVRSAYCMQSPPVTDAAGQHYPQGRIIIGHTTEAEGANPEEQEPEQQSATVKLDISWLADANIREALALLPADTPTGFRVALPSPRAARLLLERALLEGNPDAVVFKGTANATSVSALLEEVAFSEESLRIDSIVEATKELLQQELGLKPGDFIELPALFIEGKPAMPNPVNCLVCNRRVLMPSPNGPIIDGIDIIEAAIRHKVGLPESTLTFIDTRCASADAPRMMGLFGVTVVQHGVAIEENAE